VHGANGRNFSLSCNMQSLLEYKGKHRLFHRTNKRFASSGSVHNAVSYVIALELANITTYNGESC
jgi:hypothetical protein